MKQAVPRLQSVHERNISDPEISYYLGIALEGMGADHLQSTRMNRRCDRHPIALRQLCDWQK